MSEYLDCVFANISYSDHSITAEGRIAMDVELLTPQQAAARLGLSKGTLAKWRIRKDGDGPPWVRLLGGAVRYPSDELQKWIRTQAVRSTADLPATQRRPSAGRPSSIDRDHRKNALPASITVRATPQTNG